MHKGISRFHAQKAQGFSFTKGNWENPRNDFLLLIGGCYYCRDRVRAVAREKKPGLRVGVGVSWGMCWYCHANDQRDRYGRRLTRQPHALGLSQTAPSHRTLNCLAIFSPRSRHYDRVWALRTARCLQRIRRAYIMRRRAKAIRIWNRIVGYLRFPQDEAWALLPSEIGPSVVQFLA